MRYLIAGGGTGGHIVPALNIARALKDMDSNSQFLFIGSERGIEKELVSKAGFEIRLINAKPWAGICSLKNLSSCAFRIKAIIREFNADAIIGTGGYVSAPAVLASKMERKPLFVQEQNTYPGLATKLGSLFAKRVFLGFPDAEKFLWRKRRIAVTGNPVFMNIPNAGRERIYQEYGLQADSFTILVTGGSQGASALNESVKKMIDEFGLPQNAQLIWQCGKNDFDIIEKWLDGKGIPVSLHAFIGDMASVYAVTNLVICRAGALTLAETAIAGLPAILVPYPYAAADHQKTNAQSMVNSGAAIMIEQRDLTPCLLYKSITMLANDLEQLKRMSDASKALAKPDAAMVIAREIYETLICENLMKRENEKLTNNKNGGGL